MRIKTEILLSRYDTDGVGVATTAAPALHANDRVTLGEDTKVDGALDAPLETLVDVFLPLNRLVVWLFLGKEEWPDTTVQVRVLGEVLAMALGMRGKGKTYS